MEELRKQRLREIPPVNQILSHAKIIELQAEVPPFRVTETIQTVLSDWRTRILNSEDRTLLEKGLDPEDIIGEVTRTVRRDFAFSLSRVINATGIVLHTNCGRAVLPKWALEFISEIAGGYSNLELDLDTGERGSRYVHVEKLLCKLTGAEAALVVNNNAAAILLVMKELAQSKEVIVSRGELVEVGGSFRIPEVLKAGGATLVEVGATNKTRLSDYEAAVNENTALLLKVHTSNFRVVGFTEEVPARDLVGLGQEKGIPVIEDLGSGTLLDLSKWGLPYEPTVQEALGSGIDLVTFSGDKLLGGPQAGLIVGKKKFIDRLKKNQLTRALRIDKLTLTALEVVLRMYLEEKENEIPTLRMLTLSKGELHGRAVALAGDLKQVCGNKFTINIEESFSQAGGGALPTADLSTYVVSVEPREYSVSRLEEFLRRNNPPVLARISREKLLLDVRTLLGGDAESIVNLFKELAAK